MRQDTLAQGWGRGLLATWRFEPKHSWSQVQWLDRQVTSAVLGICKQQKRGSEAWLVSRWLIYTPLGWSLEVLFYGRMIAGGSCFSQRAGHMGWSIEGWWHGVVNRGMVTWGVCTEGWWHGVSVQRDGHMGWSLVRIWLCYNYLKRKPFRSSFCQHCAIIIWKEKF